MVTLTVLRQDTHHHTANNQIMEFKIPYTTYKNPTIGTICHIAHKETYNNCCTIVLGHLKCIMPINTFVTFYTPTTTMFATS